MESNCVKLRFRLTPAAAFLDWIIFRALMHTFAVSEEGKCVFFFRTSRRSLRVYYYYFCFVFLFSASRPPPAGSIREKFYSRAIKAIHAIDILFLLLLLWMIILLHRRRRRRRTTNNFSFVGARGVGATKTRFVVEHTPHTARTRRRDTHAYIIFKMKTRAI